MKTQPLTGPEIVERVFAVVASKYPGFPLTGSVTETMILDLLDAIREPSEAMIEAVSEGYLRIEDIWRVMIDALRKEIGG